MLRDLESGDRYAAAIAAYRKFICKFCWRGLYLTTGADEGFLPIFMPICATLSPPFLPRLAASAIWRPHPPPAASGWCVSSGVIVAVPWSAVSCLELSAGRQALFKCHFSSEVEWRFAERGKITFDVPGIRIGNSVNCPKWTWCVSYQSCFYFFIFYFFIIPSYKRPFW